MRYFSCVLCWPVYFFLMLIPISVLIRVSTELRDIPLVRIAWPSLYLVVFIYAVQLSLRASMVHNLENRAFLKSLMYAHRRNMSALTTCGGLLPFIRTRLRCRSLAAEESQVTPVADKPTQPYDE